MSLRALVLLTCASAGLLPAQTYGELSGRVRESWGRGIGIGGARVAIVGTRLTGTTDGKGRFRIPGVPSGEYSVRVAAAGYAEAARVGVPVRLATATGLDFFLPADTMAGVPARATAPVVDPQLLSARQRWDATELAALPAWSLDEAVALWSGAIGESYRGGRPGSQLLVVDGIPIRAAFDASTAPLGLRLPPVLVQEVSRSPAEWDDGAGSGLGGAVTAVTRSGRAGWAGGVAYFNDRLFGGSADLGTDRLVIHSEGPVGRGARLAAALEATGRLQAEPSSATRGDPATPAPWELRHNSGEWIDGAAKLTVPLGAAHGLHVLGVHSRERRLLFDPVFKYDPAAGSARQIAATLLGAEIRRTPPGLSASVRMSYFTRELTEGELSRPVEPRFGALGGEYAFRALDLARAQDTSGAGPPLPGYEVPAFSGATPWGVPAFFRGNGSRGNLFWNRYRELQLGVVLTSTGGQGFTFSTDAGAVLASAAAFQRVLAFLPVGDSVPPATTIHLRPIAVTVAARIRARVAGSAALRAGLRLDGIAPRSGAARDPRVAVSPHVEVVVPTGGVTVSASVARVSRFPDLQFLADASFDDSLAGGRFRRGDPGLQYEATSLGTVGLRFGFAAGTAVLTAYVKRFDRLVAAAAALPADSSAFGNHDDAEVVGAELRLQRSFGSRARVTVGYTLESGSYGAITGYRGPTPRQSDFLHRVVVVGDASLPLSVQAGAVLQWRSGLPYASVAPARAPTAMLVDLLMRRPFRAGRRAAWVYLDVRNALNDQSVVAVWRASRAAELDAGAVEALAQAAYAAGPAAIPYESRHYRAAADVDRNGLIEGEAELLPLYRAAAADYAQPLRSYGSPRTIRVGLELAL